MFDLLFVGNPAIDKAIAEPEDMPRSLLERIRGATLKTLEKAYRRAIEFEARGIVLCNAIVNPIYASPAQVIRLRELIVQSQEKNCETVWVTSSPTDAQEYLRILGEPKGLSFATPLCPWIKTIRSTTVELWGVFNDEDIRRTASHDSFKPLHRQLLVGWNTSHDSGHTVPLNVSSSQLAQPNTLTIWATDAPDALPDNFLPLPSVQSLCQADSRSTGCYGLAFYEPSPSDRDDTATHQGSGDQWKQLPISEVTWRTIRIESADEDIEALSELLWESCESLMDHIPNGEAAAANTYPLVIVDCRIACGTSIQRRLQIGEIVPDVKRILRDRCAAASPHIWIQSISADTEESLAALGRNRSGGQPGSSNSFTSALADLVTGANETDSLNLQTDREAAWLALELLESE